MSEDNRSAAAAVAWLLAAMGCMAGACAGLGSPTPWLVAAVACGWCAGQEATGQ